MVIEWAKELDGGKAKEDIGSQRRSTKNHQDKLVIQVRGVPLCVYMLCDCFSYCDAWI